MTSDLPRVFNDATGNMVIDTPKHESWRQAYYRKMEDQRGKDWAEFSKAIHEKRAGKLNILGSKQVAEYFGFTQATAFNYMRQGIIPSFQIGRRWFTHDYVIDEIDKRARTIIKEGYVKRIFPRMVWKHEAGVPWR